MPLNKLKNFRISFKYIRLYKNTVKLKTIMGVMGFKFYDNCFALFLLAKNRIHLSSNIKAKNKNFPCESIMFFKMKIF